MELLALSSVIVAVVVTQGGVASAYMPQLSPFFFLCNYHGNVQDLGFDTSEVTLSVSIKDNPQIYVPGQFYEVSLTSSINFNGLLLTGLYTISADAQSLMSSQFPHSPGIVGQNLMCSVVHSYVSPEPQHELSFRWLAPPAGTGCVKFLATATLGQQVLFKDTTVLQICEEGTEMGPARPELAELHSDAVIFRDDFEAAEGLRHDLWMSDEGLAVTDKCGPVVYGQHVLFCETTGHRSLTTVPLNTTSAKILQFTLSLGSCGLSSTADGAIVVSYGLQGCTQWEVIERISLSATEETEIHLISLPSRAQGSGICLRWAQEPDRSAASSSATTSYAQYLTEIFTTPDTQTTTTTSRPAGDDSRGKGSKGKKTRVSPTEPPTTTTAPFTVYFGEIEANDQPYQDRTYIDVTYEGCWALDNVVVVNTANLPTTLEEQFDPIDPSQWLFFPGAHVQHQCQSDGNAFVFDDRNQSVTFGMTRDLDLELLDLHWDRIISEQFESENIPGWTIQGGSAGTKCGPVTSGNALVFDRPGKRSACTEYLNAESVGTLRFTLGIGSGWCKSGVISDKASVLVYVEDEAEQSTVLSTLLPDYYRAPQLVSIPVDYRGKSNRIRMCWLQKRHGGLSQDMWLIDDVTVLPTLPSPSSPDEDKTLQVSLNLQCGASSGISSVDLEYSSDHGHTWHPVFTPCWPSVCHGRHQSLTSQWTSNQIKGWQRVTLPLPYYTLTPHTRFRFLQTGDPTAQWAMDDVFIGSCLERCHGHGRCTEGCSCDFDYTGPTCRDSVVPNPSTMTESFEDPNVAGNSPVLHAHGAVVGYTCDVVANGKALVFNKDGLRQLTTAELNTTEASYLQFSIRVGSHSSKSACPPSADSSDQVLLEYSCDGGITWTLIKVFPQQFYKTPRTDSVILPEAAKGEGCQFRWSQMVREGSSRAVWAVDDLVLTPRLTNTLMLDMDVQSDMGDRVTANLGSLQHSYCGAPRSMVFTGREENGEPRYLMTEALQVSPGSMVQFDLVMGCGIPSTTNLNNQVLLQYSVDHGISWAMVEKPCLPPDVCEQYRPGSVYDASQFPEWQTVTVLLSPDTWSSHTRFRWMQREWSDRDSWAIRRVYVGHQCPNMCSGHGKCNEGVCKCDPGFTGEGCQPDHDMDSDLHANFGIRYDPQSDFVSLLGGEVAHAGEGCGVILSGESFYFYKDGVRQLQTKDLNLRNEDYLQFYIRIGGGADEACRGAEERGESVLLQFSTDGGITWHLLQELLHLDYRQPRFVHLDLPVQTKTDTTRFRWWQPSHSGYGHDQWAVDEVLIGRYEHLNSLQDNFDSVSDPLESDQWRTVTEGVVAKYCQSHSPSVILGNQISDKYIITKDLELDPEDVIQFKINVACDKKFRWDHPVMLQYSHDNGHTWHLVMEPCYQHQDCDRHHTEGTIYYAGTHGAWTLVVVPVGPTIAMHPAIFRWWQPGGMPHSFSLDDVYIGPPCQYNCHRHGVCHDGECRCDEDGEGNVSQDPYCLPQSDDPNPLGMLDRFDNRNMPTDYWRRVLGGYLGPGCGVVDFGNSLYFNSDGTREAVTVPLDTSERRMLEFVIKIGSVEYSATCPVPEQRSEGIIVDYSTDNEVTWNLLKVVEPELEGEMTQTVTLELPKESKTNATIFRWWQPLGLGGMPRAGWAVDSVLVGVNDTSAFGFQDDFSGSTPNPFTWFLADTAVPRITCNSKGHALEFSTNGGMRYAETWDYHITPSTFLQFDIAMGCGSIHSTLFSVMLEYSVNMGKTWHPVVSECKPPNFECSGYHFNSDYMSDQHSNWTRITVYLPPGAVSPMTRFRWLQQTAHPRGTVWALDNVYLGDGCPWLCSGHGYCQNHTCVCDTGFSGPYCVPETPLPMELHDDFNNDEPDRSKWKEIYGGDTSDMCGHLVSGNALVFQKDHVRLAVTRDIDTTMLTTAEFYFKYGCHYPTSYNLGSVESSLALRDQAQTLHLQEKGAAAHEIWPRPYSVLMQYSTNGGISWSLLKEIHYPDTNGVSGTKRFLPATVTPSTLQLARVSRAIASSGRGAGPAFPHGGKERVKHLRQRIFARRAF